MDIIYLAAEPQEVREHAAVLLVDHFDQPRGWPDIQAARDEVEQVIESGFARGLIDNGLLLGWIGGLPEYNGRVWELHPLVVRQEFRRRGLGRILVNAFESEAAGRGALTLTLGTDDDSGMTSLSGISLYEDLPRHIAEVRDLGRGHPFLFYLKLGYRITGVVPDANGRGFPDILMSKAAPESTFVIR